MKYYKRTIFVILLILFSTNIIRAEYVSFLVGETRKLYLPTNVTCLNDLNVISWSSYNGDDYISYKRGYNYVEVTVNGYSNRSIYLTCKYEYTSALNKRDYGQYEFVILISEPYFDFTVSPSGGNVEKGQKVTFNCRVSNVVGFYSSDVTYYYSLDGSTPSTRYNSLYGLSIDNTCTLKAIASWKGIKSDVLVANYTLKGLSLTASPSEGVVEKGTIVYLTASEYGADIYYTLDGYTPTRYSTPYTSSGITINENCTLKAIAYKDGKASEVLSESYTIPVDPTGISVSLSSSSIKVGETVTANYTLSPWNARSNVSWSSDNPDIAAVNSNSGKVTGYSAGTTIIRATTANGLFGECSVTVSGSREDGILIDEENFPNEDFREYLINRYGGILSKDEIANTTSIKLNYIWNLRLTGIEYFTDLQQLDCSNSRIVGTLDLSKNTALEKLELSHCVLSSLDVSNNKSLTFLDCSVNYIKGSEMDALINSLPYNLGSSEYVFRILYNTQDEGNVCTSSQIAAAIAKGWTPYYYNGSKWVKYTGYLPTEIEINSTNFPQEDFREYLRNRFGDTLSKDEISNTTKIKLNYVWNLRLTGIEYFTDLQQLDCSNSRIVGTLDLSKNTALEKLELSHCALSSLDLSSNKSLTYLDCSVNNIKGSEMNNIINSLPIYSEGVHNFVVMSESEGDGNVITKSQVAWARRRGWITYYKSGNTLIQYEGCDPEKGDLNEDGVVDEGDLWGLRKYIMGDRDIIDSTRADINGDKNVNVADIVELVKIINKNR